MKGLDQLPIDSKAKSRTILIDSKGVRLTWPLTLVILAAKGLRPELCPIFSGATLAIIVLIEPVFSTFDIEHFEAIEIGNGLSAFILLVKANDHTKGVIV